MKGYENLQPWTWIVCAVVLFSTVGGLFFVGSRDEKWSLRLTRGGRCRLALLCILNVICIEGAGVGAESVTGIVSWESVLWKKILWNIFAGCLLAAVVMDWWEQMVYRFVWWAAGAVAGLLLLERICYDTDQLERMMLLVLFVLMQELFFARFYGRADCHAFCVCAAMLAVRGLGFRDYLMHMALVFGGLTLIQMIRGNIAGNGQLRIPVPLVPYIAAAFWFLIDFTARRWYI